MASSTTLSFRIGAGSLKSAYSMAQQIAEQFFVPVQPSEAVMVYPQRATVDNLIRTAGGGLQYATFDVEFIARCGPVEDPF